MKKEKTIGEGIIEKNALKFCTVKDKKYFCTAKIWNMARAY